MADRWNVRERLQAARGKLQKYEGRVKELEGRLKLIRGHAEDASGTARVRLRRAERDLRGTIDTTIKRLNVVLDTVEPHARRALAQTQQLARGVKAGVRAGAAKYRETGKKKK
jgi:hypothetical protein